MSNDNTCIPNYERVQILKSRLDALIDCAEFWPLSASKDILIVLSEAVSNFKAGEPQLLNEAAKYMWQYYQDVAGNFSPEELEEYNIPIITSQGNVWNHIQFYNAPIVAIGGKNTYEPGRSYISFEGEVAWEEEHRLQLVFDHGLRVCKVGPYDGHYTNAHAYADESLVDIIYK